MLRYLLVRWCASVSKVLVGSIVLGVAVAAAPAAPAHVLIRVPAGSAIPAPLPALLAGWLHAREISDVLWLTGGRSEHEGNTAKFTALAVLDFADERASAAWMEARVPLLPEGLIVRPADIVADGHLPHDSRHSVFVVNTYAPIVPREEYMAFVRGYIMPLYDAERASGHLVRTTMYLERGEPGRSDAIAVLEYRDAAAVAAMSAEKSKIRARLLATVPSYAKYDPIKDQLRRDGHGTAVNCTELPSNGNR